MQSIAKADAVTGGLDLLMTEYNESIYYDRAFYKQDIAGSLAWARANNNNGILSKEEFKKIEAGLAKVEKEWQDGIFLIKPGVDEDIHTANERRLSEIIGKEVGGKLHTGRCVKHDVVKIFSFDCESGREMSKSPPICGCGLETS